MVLKLYGEDLNVLADQAAIIGRLAATIPGATDVYVERVTGFSQVVVRLRREELARFGVSAAEVNEAVRSAIPLSAISGVVAFGNVARKKTLIIAGMMLREIP